MKKQDLIKTIEIIHMELGDFNGYEIGVTLSMLNTVIDDLIDLKSSIEKSIGGNKNG